MSILPGGGNGPPPKDDPNELYFVPVTGTYAYRDAVESPAIGERVVFTPRSPAYDNGDGRVLLPKQLVATLDNTGSIPVDFGLPAPGAAVPFYYDVTEDFVGGRPTYTIEVYASLEYIDLPTVVPYEDEIPGVPYGELVAQIADLTARIEALENPPIT